MAMAENIVRRKLRRQITVPDSNVTVSPFSSQSLTEMARIELSLTLT